MHLSNIRQTASVLATFLVIISGVTSQSGAEIVHHWRFEEDAFLADSIGGANLEDRSAFGQQLSTLPRDNDTLAGQYFPSSLAGIGENRTALESTSSARSYFANNTTRKFCEDGEQFRAAFACGMSNYHLYFGSIAHPITKVVLAF